jgi:signal transduction histidine kinase
MDQLKVKLSENLHDNIGASLNHIKMLSNELSRDTPQPIEKNKILAKIKNTSNQMMYDLYDMLWTLKKEKSTVGDLIEKLQDHADNVLSDFDVPYHFYSENISENDLLTTKEKMNIYAIFKESINNILKHTHSNEVTIKLEKANAKHFQMSIINEYSQKVIHEGLSDKKGIVNMKNRANEISGQVNIVDGESQFEVIFSF